MMRPYLAVSNDNPGYPMNADTQSAYLDGYMTAGQEYGEAEETRHAMIRETAWGCGMMAGILGTASVVAAIAVLSYLFG